MMEEIDKRKSLFMSLEEDRKKIGILKGTLEVVYKEYGKLEEEENEIKSNGGLSLILISLGLTFIPAIAINNFLEINGISVSTAGFWGIYALSTPIVITGASALNEWINKYDYKIRKEQELNIAAEKYKRKKRIVETKAEIEYLKQKYEYEKQLADIIEPRRKYMYDNMNALEKVLERIENAEIRAKYNFFKSECDRLFFITIADAEKEIHKPEYQNSNYYDYNGIYKYNETTNNYQQLINFYKEKELELENKYSGPTKTLKR